ncbi:MAG: hypothetical protein HC875_41280, partial [Anaerolineales bacterium]|nr:hypothetical protein [Anaerolineales bacterium]
MKTKGARWLAAAMFSKAGASPESTALDAGWFVGSVFVAGHCHVHAQPSDPRTLT